MNNRIKLPTVKEISALVRSVRSDICADYRAYDGDETPGILLTVGADRKGSWSYQTGDNSFTGGAYSFRAWGVVAVRKDSNSYEVAREIIAEIEDALLGDIEGEKYAEERREKRALMSAGLHASQTGGRGGKL